MKNRYNVQEYLYDFAVDGGAIGTIVLSSKKGKNPLPVDAIVTGVTARVLTAPLSTGSATISWGNNTVTAYSGTAIAIASLTLNSLHTGRVASSSIWDDTNDRDVPLLVTDETTDGTFKIAIATEALTAGKIIFEVEYLHPAVEV